MNLFLVVIIVACLPDPTHGFSAAQFRASGIRHCAKSSSCHLSRQNTRSNGQESTLSSILTFENIDTVRRKRNVKSILIQRLRRFFQHSHVKTSELGTEEENARQSVGSNVLTSSSPTINIETDKSKAIKQKLLSDKVKRILGITMINILTVLKLRPCFASGGVGVGVAPKSNFTPFQGACIWGCLFVLSATLHSAESAITKISPWKVC